MFATFQPHVRQQLDDIRAAGTYKNERVIITPQGTTIRVADGRPVLNLCANNYLGLAQHPAIATAAKAAIDQWGYGCASVRFICGTQGVHKQLETKLSEFLGTEDTILYSSCFDANGGLFETLLGPEDAIISDELNHASIIDGIRLCKAQRHRYANNNMADLEAKLKDAAGARFKLIATDGVFSMDGYIANLSAVCDLAEQYGALVMVDDSHAVGFMGRTGRGTHELCGVMNRVDIITGTLGKALGGAAGGYVAGKQHVIDLLVQRSRPSLFSNALPATVAYSANKAIEIIEKDHSRVQKLHKNVMAVREGLRKLGYDAQESPSAIIPIMIGDTAEAIRKSRRLLELGVWAVAFGFPVVPQGKARIRVQVSAALEAQHIEKALDAFAKL